MHWYGYRDEQGRLLYQHGRTPHKEFPFRIPDAGHWGLQPGVRRVLYRLPELAQARRGQWVYVVEGEKDADRLAAMGQIATCNDNGAGKWPEGCDHYFRDLNVIILAYNDRAGLAHARLVAKRLELSTRSDRPPMAHFLEWSLSEPAVLRDSAQKKKEDKPVQNTIGGLAPPSKAESEDGAQLP